MKRRNPINFTFIFGLISVAAVAGYTGLHASSNPLIYLNFIGVVIVFGGLSTVTFMILPLEELRQLSRTLLWLFRNNKWERVKTVTDLYQFSSLQQQDLLNFSRAGQEAGNTFLREAMDLLSLGLKNDDLNKIFDLKMEAKASLSTTQAGFLLTLAKLGPGFGLVGTLVGLVSLLYQMGQGMGLEQIGPAMGIALCATLYGVATANLMFIPLAEAIVHKGEREELHMKLILCGAQMLRDRRHPVHLREALKAYLTPAEVRVLNQYLSHDAGPAAQKERGIA